MQNSRTKLKTNQQKRPDINKKIQALALILSLTITPAFSVITDDFAESTLDKNLKIKEHKTSLIIDTFAEENKNKSTPAVKAKLPAEVLPVVIKPYKRRKYIITEEFRPEVPIRIVNYFTTRNKPQEGASIDFVTVADVRYKDKFYPAGTKVNARIETVTDNSMNGVPADVVIGSFDINGTPLYGEITKTGADRMLWVKPLSFVVGFLGVPGLLLMFVRGGHAKIKPNEVYKVYF